MTAHGDNEYVLKSELLGAVDGYKRLVRETLRQTRHVPALVPGQGVFDEGSK